MMRYALIALLGLLLAGCKPPDAIVSREGEPDFYQDFDKFRMAAAIAEAQETLDTFSEALAQRQPGQTDFAVKYGETTTGGGTEYLWITQLRMWQDGFTGSVNNKPVHLQQLKEGDEVRVERNQVVDWMFMQNGKLRGGYTVAALTHGTPNQAEYETNLGIDWSQYRFLSEVD